MADFSTTFKYVVTKSAKFIGKTASTAVKATKYKLKEMDVLGKRRDLLKDLGDKVYELTANGLVLPEEAAEIVRQLTEVDMQLNTLRAEHAAQKAAEAERKATEKAARAAEQAAAKTAAAIELSTEPVAMEVPEVQPPEAENETSVPTLNVDISADVAADAEETAPPTLNI